MVLAFVSVFGNFGNHYLELDHSPCRQQYLIARGQFDVPRSMPSKPLGKRGLVPHLTRRYSFYYSVYSPPSSHGLSLACKNFEFFRALVTSV